jgi:hypothetical protein
LSENRKQSLALTVQHDLHDVVYAELAERGLLEPHALAAALDMPIVTAAGILSQGVFPVPTSLWLADRLDLSVSVEVRPAAA